MRFNTIILSSLLAVSTLTLGSCSGRDDKAPLLRGHIDAPEGSEIILGVSLDNDVVNTQYITIELDSLGNYEYRPDSLPQGFTDTDVELYVNDRPFGAYLERGKTAELNVSVDPATGEATAEYAGDNADVSEFITDYNRAYDIMQYFSMDDNDTTTYEQYRARLDSNYAKVKEALPGIKSDKIRDFYTQMNESKYVRQKATLISDMAYREKKALVEYPEFVELAKTVDPNTEAAGRSSAYYLYLILNNPDAGVAGTLTSRQLISELPIIDRGITYEPNRRRALSMAGTSFFVYNKPTSEEVDTFMEEFTRIAAPYPALIEKYVAVGKQIKEALKAGDPMPVDPELQAPDGSMVKLSSLYGKVLYIDVWATWCGPCQREIPKFAEAYQRFKGKGIEFISISVDQDEDAWLAQLKHENPAWPQYRLTPEENQKFSTALSITGIPRFILIGADGKLISPDATRPSSPDIDEVLNATL